MTKFMNLKIMQHISSGFRWRLLFFLITILGCQSSYGQSSSGNPVDIESLFKNQQIATPAAAALKQNIVYPVNYSTGLPEIKIPLYEVRSGEITLPIYLTYHASGIKLSDPSGWTGLGWNLVAEPMITRTVQGQVDSPVTMTCKFDKNAYRKYGASHAELVAKGATEEPDEYYYRLSDKQGMFMYAMEPVDASRSFLPLPYNDIRIDWMGKYFRIVDDDGTIYNFNGACDVNQKSLGLIGWKASSVVASNRKDSISFVYNSWTNRYFTKNYNDYIVVKDNSDWKVDLCTDRTDIDQLCGTPCLPDEWMQEPILMRRQNNTTSCYQVTDSLEIVPDGYIPDQSTQDMPAYTDTHPLSEIHFPQGTITFTQDNKYQRLDKMTIRDLQGNFVREFRFNYVLNSSLSITNRYYLDSLVITDKDGTPQETYHFGYDNPKFLPAPGTRAIDYWGYFNNVFHSVEETLVPWQSIEVTRGHVTPYPNYVYYTTKMNINIGSPFSRESDEEYMKYGTLNSITYPAGAKDEFVYEAHRYRTEEGDIKIAGGLRIKEIKTVTSKGQTKIRSFKYGLDEDGCGTPATTNPLDYFRLVQNMYICEPLVLIPLVGKGYTCGPLDGQHIRARHRTYFCGPTRTMTFEGGSSVVYSYITEYNGTPEHNSGKTVYEYDTRYPLPLPEDMNAIRCDKHDGWKYNNLKCKTIYRNDGGKYTPLEQTLNDYIIDKYFGKIITGEAAAQSVIVKSGSGYVPNEARLGYDYIQTEIPVQTKLLSKTIHFVYADGKAIGRGMSYKYDDPATTCPTQITETGSDGCKYVTDLIYPQNCGDTYPYPEMVERNMLSLNVKKKYSRSGQYLEIETPYNAFSENVYQPESAIIRRSTSESGDIRCTYIYDSYGRKRQETKDGKENVVYLYGYNNQHVIACIENATYEEVVAKLGGEEEVKKIAATSYPLNTIDLLRTSLPAARVTTYAYKPLVGISSITDPTGLTTCYEYDDLGRLVRTYIQNGTRQETVERQEYHYAN